MSSPSRSKLASGLVVAGATVLALALGEGVVRAFGLAPDVKPIEAGGSETVYRRSANPVLGFELKRDWRDESADCRRSFPFTNSHGQRDLERSVAKPDGTRRVILLGDSVVEGHGICDLDDTIGRRLEALFDGERPREAAERGGAGSSTERVEVLNFGVSAYCTLAEVELLETKGLRFEPDVVVLVFVENDFFDFNQEAFELEAAHERPVFVKRLFVTSHLFRMAAIRLDLFGYRAEADPIRWNHEAIGSDNVVRGLARLADLAEQHGFVPVVAIWPRFLDDDIADVHDVPGSGELVIERLARAEGVPAFRLSRRFLEAYRELRAARAAPVSPRREFTLGDRIHPSPAGCQVAAEAIFEILESNPKTGPRGPRDPEAVAAARRRGNVPPNAARLAVNAANRLRSEGRLPEAIAKYEEAIAIDPTLASAHANLGNVLQSLGRRKEAVSHYEVAVDLDPTLGDTLTNLGIALRELGRTDEAILRWESAVRVAPEYFPARLALAGALASTGRLADALRHFEKAVELRPGAPEARNNYGLALAMAGRADEAIARYEEALRLRPAYAEAFVNWGVALEARGDLDGAMEKYRRALEARPDHAKARHNLGNALVRSGRVTDGVTELSRVAEAGAGPARDLAWTLATHPEPRVRDPERAVKAAELAIRLAGAGPMTGGQRAVLLDTHAAALAAAGRFEDATVRGEEALELAAKSGLGELAASIHRRLALYRRGESWVATRE